MSKIWKKAVRETKVAYHKSVGHTEHAKAIRKQKRYQDLIIHREDFKKDLRTVKKFVSEHKTELIVGAVIITALTVGIPPEATTVLAVTGAIQNQFNNSDNKTYTNLKDSTAISKGKKFTDSQKDKIIAENIKRNGGVLKSDLSGKVLLLPKVYVKGYQPPNNEAQIDHIIPRSKGGTNSYQNAQVLSREENLIKSDN